MAQLVDRIPGGIDRTAGTALHVQLRELLRHYITHQLQPGAAFPSERDLSDRFGLARMTVRQAIDALVGEEVIERVVGLGTFVRKPKLDLQVKLTSYSEEMQRRGMVPAARVLSFEQIPATVPSWPGSCSWRRGTPLVRFRRLLLADNEPMSVDENFIPAHRVPGLLDDAPPTSLYNVLSERYGLVMEWGEDMIEATAASPSIARLLQRGRRDAAAEDPAPRLRFPGHGGLLRLLSTAPTATSCGCRCSAPASGHPRATTPTGGTATGSKARPSHLITRTADDRHS